MDTMMPGRGDSPPDFRHRGQTLAEFAISLPILLLLLFGVLEFGRLFQSWVTLQNAARTAARYAITGLYNEQKYDIDLLVPCHVYNPTFSGVTYPAPIYTAPGQPAVNIGVSTYGPPNSNLQPPATDFELVPVNNNLLNGATYFADPVRQEIFNNVPRRAYENLYNAGGLLVLERGKPFTQEAINALTGSVRVFTLNPDESLFATWYGKDQGDQDCYPSDDSLQDRKDMLRLATIYDEARRGASGLQLDPSLTGTGTRVEYERFIHNFWSNPSPNQENRAWFNVMMCSARGRRSPTTETIITNNDDDPISRTVPAEATLRFETYMGDTPPNEPGARPMPGGACLLKEQPRGDTLNTPEPVAYMLNNYDKPWADAGGSGERISLVITYNHPLITPLGLARFVRIQARRSAVNESFKVTSAERVIGPGGSGVPDLVSPTAPPPSPTPLPSDTPGPQPSNTYTPTTTFTPSPSPFDCNKITAGGMYFDLDGRSIVVQFTNDNDQLTEFTHAKLIWPVSKILGSPGAPKYPTAYFAFSSVEQDVHWVGNAPNPAAPFADLTAANISPIDSLDGVRGTFYDTAFREVGPHSDTQWKGTFLDVGQRLGDLIGLYDFSGSIFYFKNLNNPAQDCAIPVETPPPPPSPTSPPAGWTASATHTPDCADRRLTVSFVRFESAGDVRLRVTNSRPIPGYLIGFRLYWPNDIPGIKFARMVVGGTNVNDIPDPVTNPGGTGKVVWQNVSGGTTVSPTYSGNTTTGAWLGNYTFPPNSVTDVHLDFTGSGASSLQALGAFASDFNGTVLRILCTPPTAGQGGPAGPGGMQQGDIGFDAVNTPQPTNPPPPTVTPGPTLTPSLTSTPRPPTSTWTKGPPTNTPLPSATARATNTPPPPPTNTPRDLGNSDGG